MSKRDNWSSVFWLIVAVLTANHAYRLGLGNLRNPGPGFFFFWGGICLALLSLSILVSSFAPRKTDRSQEPSGIFANTNWRKVLFVLISVILYGVLFERLGYLISTFLLIAFLLRSIEAKKWFIVLGVALLSSILSYGLFALWLQVRLPKGMLGI